MSAAPSQEYAPPEPSARELRRVVLARLKASLRRVARDPRLNAESWKVGVTPRAVARLIKFRAKRNPPEDFSLSIKPVVKDGYATSIVIKYNPSRICRYTDEELNSEMAHELIHILMFPRGIEGVDDKYISNLIQDIAINCWLLRHGFYVPSSISMGIKYVCQSDGVVDVKKVYDTLVETKSLAAALGFKDRSELDRTFDIGEEELREVMSRPCRPWG